jgi:hypothetical protein
MGEEVELQFPVPCFSLVAYPGAVAAVAHIERKKLIGIAALYAVHIMQVHVH